MGVTPLRRAVPNPPQRIAEKRSWKLLGDTSGAALGAAVSAETLGLSGGRAEATAVVAGLAAGAGVVLA